MFTYTASSSSSLHCSRDRKPSENNRSLRQLYIIYIFHQLMTSARLIIIPLHSKRLQHGASQAYHRPLSDVQPRDPMFIICSSNIPKQQHQQQRRIIKAGENRHPCSFSPSVSYISVRRSAFTYAYIIRSSV